MSECEFEYVSKTDGKTNIQTDRQRWGGGESFSTWITYVTCIFTYFIFRGGERVQFVDYLCAGSGDACDSHVSSQVSEPGHGPLWHLAGALV